MRNTYLSVSGISVTHKPLVMSWDNILCHVKWFVKEFEVRHIVTDVHLASFYVAEVFMIHRCI